MADLDTRRAYFRSDGCSSVKIRSASSSGRLLKHASLCFTAAALLEAASTGASCKNNSASSSRQAVLAGANNASCKRVMLAVTTGVLKATETDLGGSHRVLLLLLPRHYLLGRGGGAMIVAGR